MYRTLESPCVGVPDIYFYFFIFSYYPILKLMKLVSYSEVYQNFIKFALYI